MTPLQTLRILGPELAIDVRFRCIRDRWIASVDTPYGPTLGLGLDAVEAIGKALDGVGDIEDDLRDRLPDHPFFLF